MMSQHLAVAKQICTTLVLTLGIALSACTAQTDDGATAAPPATGATATPTVAVTPPEQVAYWRAWERGPHADTYDLEKGPNTYCAKCHSPANWDISAKIDDPPDCVSCKFSFEDEPRIAEGNPLVPESEWESIGCDVCHRVEGGVVDPAIAWRERTTGYYESLSSSTALCEKCHLDNETLAHERHLGTAHAGFECTDCHNPHDASANCHNCHTVNLAGETRYIAEHETVKRNEQCVECHNGAWEAHPMHVQQSGGDDCMGCHGELMGQSSLTPIQYGHSGYHATVTCAACHDAAGLQVAPMEERALWITFRTTELLGRTQQEPYQSHTLQRSVDCRRCHYPNNAWDLNTELEVDQDD